MPSSVSKTRKHRHQGAPSTETKPPSTCRPEILVLDQASIVGALSTQIQAGDAELFGPDDPEIAALRCEILARQKTPPPPVLSPLHLSPQRPLSSPGRLSATAKSAGMKENVATTKENTSNTSETPGMRIEFNLKIAKSSEIHKQPSKRANIGQSLELSPNEPYDTFVAQCLAKISRVLRPKKEDWSLYDVQYTIPRKLKDPTPIYDAKDYERAVSTVASMKNPIVDMFVCEKESGNKRKHSTDSSSSESQSSSDSSTMATKKKKKPKKKFKKKEPQFANAIAMKINDLMQRWACSEPDNSTHCFFTADDPTHIPLTNVMLRTWAEHLVKNDPAVATIDRPPHHHDFDLIPSRAKGLGTQLLQRRLQSLKSGSNPHDRMTIAPVIHVHNSPTPGPTHAPATPPSAFTRGPIMLISGQGGENMPIETFCEVFQLNPDIRSRLKENGFENTRSLRRVSIEDLNEMGFKRGQVCTLQDAIEDWESK